MSNVRFLYNNLFDAATLTPSSEVTTLPASNLKNKLIKKVWRTTSITSQYLIVDLGSSQYVNSFSIINFNFTSDATYTVKASNNSDFTNLLFSQIFDVWEPLWGAGEGGAGEHGAGGYLLTNESEQYTSFNIQFFSPVEARYWKIEFADPANPDGYFQIGRMWIGEYFEPATNFSYDWEIHWEDPSKVSESLGGQPWTDLKEKYRLITLSLNYLDDSEKYHEIMYLQNLLGIGRDFILSLKPDKDSSEWFFTTLYGRLVKTEAIKNYNYGLNQTNFEFKESR